MKKPKLEPHLPARRLSNKPEHQSRSQSQRNEHEADPTVMRAATRPKIKKSHIYEALHGLNAGIQQFINSLKLLDKTGLGVPFLNGYRIVAEEIRSAVNFSTTEAMSVIELLDYQQLEALRSKLSFPQIGDLHQTARNNGAKNSRARFSNRRRVKDFGTVSMDNR